MDTTVTRDSLIDDLDLSFRIYGALRRNDVRLVGDVLSLSDAELLRMRGFGPTSLAQLDVRLGECGLHREAATSAECLPRPLRTPAEGLERARWVGRQLDLISQDIRAQPVRLLGDRTPGGTVERRRYAWRMYRWAAGYPEETSMPNMRETGAAFEVCALPGSAELHLEALNELARAELDAPPRGCRCGRCRA
jgi:hypothetical protein